MLNKLFLLAGHAIFTIEIPEDAQQRATAKPHYTYLISKFSGRQNEDLYSVNLLGGPNNEADYVYLGMLNQGTGEVRLTAKSHFSADTDPVKLIQWALRHAWAGSELPQGWALHHEGHCGRTLTTPESIETGFGPECAKILGLTHKAAKAAPTAKQTLLNYCGVLTEHPWTKTGATEYVTEASDLELRSWPQTITVTLNSTNITCNLTKILRDNEGDITHTLYQYENITLTIFND